MSADPGPETVTNPGEAPTQVGGLRILRLLGEGGMARVYAAEDQALERTVAVKVLRRRHRGSRSIVGRFVREARAMAKISSPHVVAVYSVGEDPAAGPYLVMEQLDGEDLGKRITRLGPVPVEEALRYAKGAVAGLRAAAEAGIIHRDVKPANLFLHHGRVKLTDFGLALPLEGDARLTREGLVVGTPFYLAPELARGREPSVASDIYALGASLYECLTGHPPYRAATALEVVSAHLQRPVPNLRESHPDFPESLSQLLSHMMAKEPSERLPSYDLVEQRLEQVANDLVNKPAGTGIASSSSESTPQGGPLGPAAGSWRRRGLVLGAALIVALPFFAFAFGDEETAKDNASAASPSLLLPSEVPAEPVDDAPLLSEEQARAQLVELDAIAKSQRTPAQERDRGSALLRLGKERSALIAFARAARGGELDRRALTVALQHLHHERPERALSLLKAWPQGDQGVDQALRTLLSDAWSVRHHALSALESRGVATDNDRRAVAMLDVTGTEACERRLAGLQVLARIAYDEDALRAVDGARSTDPGARCLQRHLDGAERDIAARIDVR